VASNAVSLWAYLVACSVIPFLLLLLLLGSTASADISGTRTFFSWKPFVKLGEWSFAFCLVHLVVLRSIIGVSARTAYLPWWAVSMIALIIGLAAAAVLCEFVEKPLERRLRGDGGLPASREV
jgi:peptidoglycan/LPS O-acetylase OafA/YrhL